VERFRFLLTTFSQPNVLEQMKEKNNLFSEATKGMSCTSSAVTPMLTDLYQISMAYAYFNSGRHEESAVFDLFFRKCPFKGEICVFAGLDECLKFIHNYSFSSGEIDFLQKQFPHWNPAFFEYLASIDCSEIKVIHLLSDFFYYEVKKLFFDQMFCS
jgi:hypothetical protein